MDEDAIGAAVDALREGHPLVQCLTNNVVTNWTANVLLACGAAPAMVDNPHEAGGFARVASAVLVNLGTPQDATVAAMFEAVRACAEAGTPWVLDPVAAGALPWRTGVARDLVAAHAPKILRGNASEITGLSGGAGGRGVDADSPTEEALPAAQALAADHQLVVAVSGPTDLITDGSTTVTVANGTPLLTQVTGGGCALGALMAAFTGVVQDPMLAATAATALYTVAADEAATRSHAPGSFAVAFLDALTTTSGDQVVDDVRLGRR